jgi:hypothetical protein
MPAKSIRLPQHVLAALQEAADRMGGLPLDAVVAAVARAFSRHEEPYRKYVVHEFWFGALPRPCGRKMTWGRRLYELVRSVAARIALRAAR